MAGFVSDTSGSIGYLGLVPARLYEQEGNLKIGVVKNSDGDFVKASPESLAVASRSVLPFIRNQPTDFRISITNSPEKSLSSGIFHMVYRM
jgi:hypothetical protein